MNDHDATAANERRVRDAAQQRWWLALALACTTVPLSAVMVPSAHAALINDPPANNHSIIAFPERDFIHGDGWSAQDTLKVELLRNGIVVATSVPITPVDDPTTTGFDGMFDLNHAAGFPCWSAVTPDVRGGDLVRVTDQNGNADQTTTALVTVTQKATVELNGDVTIRGTASDALGQQLPTGQLEARVVAKQQSFNAGGKRTIRNTPVYDTPTGTTWTASWSGLDQHDKDMAVANESRGLWLGRNPGAVTPLGSPIEGTIDEFGAFGGPAPGCNAPLATGPSTPHMTAATDSGASSADGITNVASPTFIGLVGAVTATGVNLYVDGILNGTGTVAPDGTYTASPATGLAPGRHTVNVGEFAAGAPDTQSAGALPVTIDTSAPTAPTLSSTNPVSPGTASSPAVKGAAEPGSTVTVFTDATCSAAASVNGAAAALDTGIPTPAAPNATTTFAATATDVAGNTSDCSTPVTYVHDSIAPAAPTIDPTSTSGSSAATVATFVFAGAEPGLSYECSRDGAAFAVCTSPITYNGVSTGGHSLALRALDGAGNTSGATSTTWTVQAPATVPDAPTIGAVSGSVRSVTVRWTAPAHDGGSGITGYVVTLTDSAGRPLRTLNLAASARSAQIVGLANGTRYRAQVAATNAVGRGRTSAMSAAAGTLSVASAPAIASAGSGVLGDRMTSATASWRAPSSSGGSAVTRYAVTAIRSNGSRVTRVVAANVRSLRFAGLVGGRYRFQVVAINAVGASRPSALSNQVMAR